MDAASIDTSVDSASVRTPMDSPVPDAHIVVGSDANSSLDDQTLVLPSPMVKEDPENVKDGERLSELVYPEA